VEAIDERLDAAGIPEAPAAGEEPGGEEPGGGEATTPPTSGAEATSTTAPVDTSPTTTSIVTATTVAGGSTDLSPLGQPIDFRLAVVVAPGPADSPPVPGVNSFPVPPGQVLSITDIVLQNPTGATGDLRIKRSGVTLFETQLANYRDLDFHFVSPYQFAEGSTVDLEVICTVPGPGTGECGASASFAGFQREI
jgi:hypothetical protein